MSKPQRFRRKSTCADAIQWDGTVKGAKPIIKWAKTFGHEASIFEAEDAARETERCLAIGDPDLGEFLLLRSGHFVVWENDRLSTFSSIRFAESFEVSTDGADDSESGDRCTPTANHPETSEALPDPDATDPAHLRFAAQVIDALRGRIVDLGGEIAVPSLDPDGATRVYSAYWVGGVMDDERTSDDLEDPATIVIFDQSGTQIDWCCPYLGHTEPEPGVLWVNTGLGQSKRTIPQGGWFEIRGGSR